MTSHPHTATLSSKFQIAIPKQMLEHLGIEPGDRVVLEVAPEGQLILVPLYYIPRNGVARTIRNGRIDIPEPLLEAVGMKPGDNVSLRITQEGELAVELV